MAWGKKAGSGMDDLVAKISDAETLAVYVLPFRSVSDAGAADLGAAIGSTECLDEFYASGHRLSAAALASFGDGFARNSTLKHICVGDESLGDVGASALLQKLQAHPVLQELDLEHKGLTGSCFMELQAVCAGVPTLSRLRLGRNALQPACLPLLLRALKAAPGVTTLALQDCKLTAEDVLPLAQAMREGQLPLRELDLTYNALGDGDAACAVMAALGGAAALHTLRVSSTGIGPAAAKAFADARNALPDSQLRTLWLNRNPLSLEGLGHAVRAIAQPYASGAQHTELQVQWCIPAGGVSGGCVHDLLHAATAGGDSKALHVGTLDLKGCALGEEGLRSVVYALRRGGAAPAGISASHVSLFGVAAGNAGVQALAEHLLEHAGEHSMLEVLDVGGNDLTDSVSTSLQQLLSIGDGEGGGATPPLSSLKVLDVSANDLSEDGIAALLGLASGFSSLQLLHAGQGEKRRETQEGDESVAAAAAAAQGAAATQ